MATPVVYLAKCSVCGRGYIGFSSRFRGRKKQHKKLAQRLQPKTRFHRHLRKCGFANFTWEILYKGDDAKYTLNVVETAMIAKYSKLMQLDNMTPGGGNWKRRTRKRRYKSPNALTKSINRRSKQQRNKP